MLLLAWFLGNIVPFFGAAVDLLGASVTPWGKPKKGGNSAWRKFPGCGEVRMKVKFHHHKGSLKVVGGDILRKNSSIKNLNGSLPTDP